MKRHVYFLLLIIVVLFVLPHRAQSQIVNIEKKRLGQFEEGWFGNVDLGLSLTSNTRTIWQVANRANVQYNKGRSSIMALGDVKLVMVEQERFLNSGFGHARYNRAFTDRRKIVLEAFGQYSYNKPQRIDRRILMGGGTRFNVLTHDSLEMHVGTLIMYEDEAITDTTQVNQDVRASTYLSLVVKPSKTVTLNSITYFQPRLEEFGDFRLSNETSLILSITQQLQFSVVWDMVYDTFTPEGVPELNYKLANKLRFSF